MPLLSEALQMAANLARDNERQEHTLHVLAKELEEGRMALGTATFERADLLDLLAMCQDEAAALASDLDDMQAEWAAEYQAHEKLIDTHIQCRSDLLDERRMRVAACERIMELEALDRQSVERADAQASEIARLEENIDSLNCLIEYSRLEVLEANRLRVAAFERNAELEGREKRLLSALERLVRVFDLGEVAYTVINGRAPSALEDAREAIAVCGPRAPSVPRHRFPNEAEAPL